jgi:hypothetical protein
MKTKTLQAVLAWTGVVLVVIGVTGIVLQVFLGEPPWFHFSEVVDSPQTPQEMTAHLNEMAVSRTGIQLKTKFVGLELIVVGAVLQIVAFLGASPWHHSSNSN